MNARTFIIAEMACSHEGDFSLAKKIIDASSAAGADAVQLQIWSLSFMMSPHRKEYELLKRIAFSENEWADLVQYSQKNYPDLEVYVCLYEHASIDFVESLGINGYKLNSADLSNPLVLDKVAATGKPINLSVGASTLSEIQAAVGRIRSVSSGDITLMYGYQSFPTNPENIHMGYMEKLKDLFELPIGYQDHCDADNEHAFWLPAASMGMGVTVLEKHLTHDRGYKGIDYESALNPDEFIRFVEMVRSIDKAKGVAIPREFSDDERKYREFQKKSVVASRDLSSGSIICLDDLSFLRAETLGLPPDQFESLIGKTLIHDIHVHQSLSEDDVR